MHNGEISIRNGCYGSSFRNKSLLYKLVLEVCKEWNILEKTLTASGIKYNSSTKYLLMILIREFANDPSNKKLGNILDEFDKNKARLRSEYVQAKLSIPALKLTEEKVKWARINGVTSSIEKVIEELKSLGFSEKIDAGELGEKEYRKDQHMKFLLQFNPKSIQNLSLYKRGELIIQDKASCIPVYILDPKPGSMAIDACSAPGNKSTQLAAALKDDSGKQLIVAYEKDPHRYKVLQNMISDCHCQTLIKCENRDFLTVPPQAGFKYIVVDPSCSGSGMRLSLERQIQKDQTGVSKERISSLANFQSVILKHALSFPDAERVVYSTCSIFAEENEAVVDEALKSCSNWTLLKNPFPDWPTRGLDKYPFCKDVIRSDPGKNDCIGFFAACFVRRE